MIFGPVPLARALGAVLAHSHAVPGGRLRKGKVLAADDLARLKAAGTAEVVVARLDPGDLAEDVAAERVGAVLTGSGLRAGRAATGRVNLFAEGRGILDLDPAAVARLNGVDPMLTLATLPLWARVAPGDMVATVKVIAYGVAAAAVERAEAAGAWMAVRPALFRDATLIETGAGPRASGKGEDAVRSRLTALGIDLAEVVHVAHDTPAIAAAIRSAGGGLVLILTSSATSDPLDVAPQAVRAVGGQVTRVGMPVDPGNLLFLGHVGDRPIIGLPGCARSAAPNGADLVLDRIACGVPVTDADIAAMGVGGLLKETRARGRPRAATR